MAVYLRLRPPPAPTTSHTSPQSLYPTLPSSERYLTVETLEEGENGMPTHITITPPTESRRRAVEKFAFTKVFEEDSTQLDIFKGTGVLPLIEAVLGPDSTHGRDGLIATLGVTGSGKRGLTQLSLDVIFNSLGPNLLHPSANLSLCSSLSASDVSEAQLLPANIFLESLYGESETSILSHASSRAQTPMTMVGDEVPLLPRPPGSYPSLLSLGPWGPTPREDQSKESTISFNISRVTRSRAKMRNELAKDGYHVPAYRRRQPPCTSMLPQLPDVSDVEMDLDGNSDYAIVISMYEVYNDRIFDLLTPQSSAHSGSSKSGQQKDKRRALLFKSTEKSPDRKVVAGLRKIICGDLNEALMVLETGLYERRVAGTGSNSVSSRSHGFFCVEVKKRNRASHRAWNGSTLTIVDLAGSERARNANTAGATLAEAGKINESLMYLGQCLQMQSDNSTISNKPALVPFRQCKLTELLFSNSFPSASVTSYNHTSSSRNPQKAIMIVTADPLGDFNATSQILRYSALAREVTVPRVPSVTSTILSGTTANKSNLTSGRTTPSSCSPEELEYAAQEIARLTEELDVMGLRLTDEELRRKEMENAWKSAEERCALMEQDVREECWVEMERRIEEERRRWKGAWGEEADRNDEHLDKKLEILTRTIQIHEDPEPSSGERIEELEDENEALRRKVDLLERELRNRSPTKKQRTFPAPRSLAGDEDLENAVRGFGEMKLDEAPGVPLKSKTPAKKQRKLTTRKWDAGMDMSSP
ncbi:hypothetical protein FGG08_002242 [Glutinoglossum americanum]|uniref:Kinesin-like protein n=1 Tax=Glutinoglossum americanum TaxID=1670608 RepID=A0A9P8I0K9_9PEZI|nr:hypothetical protein FGG08_002242 [Glutinoglossum americanum]